jgi:hypothetical protein
VNQSNKKTKHLESWGIKQRLAAFVAKSFGDGVTTRTQLKMMVSVVTSATNK